MESSSFASSAGSRYANGEQMVCLIHKQMVEKLSLQLPGRIWWMADRAVDVQI